MLLYLCLLEVPWGAKKAPIPRAEDSVPSEDERGKIEPTREERKDRERKSELLFRSNFTRRGAEWSWSENGQGGIMALVIQLNAFPGERDQKEIESSGLHLDLVRWERDTKRWGRNQKESTSEPIIHQTLPRSSCCSSFHTQINQSINLQFSSSFHIHIQLFLCCFQSLLECCNARSIRLQGCLCLDAFITSHLVGFLKSGEANTKIIALRFRRMKQRTTSNTCK